jgi:hypothetical protein
MATAPLDEPMHFNDNEIVIKGKNPYFTLPFFPGLSIAPEFKGNYKGVEKSSSLSRRAVQ